MLTPLNHIFRHSLPGIAVLLLLLGAGSGFSAEDSIQESIENEASWEREQGAVEDPLGQQQSEKIDNPFLRTIMPDTFDLYGSLRYRYRAANFDSFFGDGGSRIGADGQYQFFESYWLLGRAEAGFNLFERLDLLFNPEGRSRSTRGDDVFLRLAYVGIETPRTFLTFGKNWSTYYQVASFTDRFQGTGASASGTFNAGTDGGPSGTGRADNVLQSRIMIDHLLGEHSIFKPFALNVQFQDGERIPHAEDISYDYSLGCSFILERRDNIKTGIAINYAAVNKNDLPALRAQGIDGDDLSVLVGVQWLGPKWYAATTFSWMKNHMATRDGIYFDAWGNELYGHYELANNWWLVGGWNYLEPLPGNEQAGNFVLRYGVIELRYTFKDFKRMIYANVRFDKSRMHSSGNDELGNTYTVGIKWDFDWTM